MKTKKIIFSALLLIGNMTIYAQLNPIKNLLFRQDDNFISDYPCMSSNCFSITWNKPDSSKDSLKGYIVYKNNKVFAFTPDTVVQCWGNTPCLYPGFFENNFPCWISVKAVYNKDSLLSVATDSVYVYNITIDVKENGGVLKSMIN
jgi:hypothetical protein